MTILIISFIFFLKLNFNVTHEMQISETFIWFFSKWFINHHYYLCSTNI